MDAAVSGGGLETQLDRPYAQQPATRDAARRVISREEDADLLLAALGLVEDEPPTVDGKPACPTCGRPRRRAKLGGYHPCQRELCSGEAP